MGFFDKLFGRKKAEPEKEIVFEKTLPQSKEKVVDIQEPVDRFGRTKLQQAALAGEVGSVIMQLSIGARVDHRDNENKTALHLAAAKGYTEVAKELLDAGADVNAVCDGRMTPLIWAAQENHPEMTALLVERGADLDMQRDGGMTALMHVWASGSQEVARILLAAGASTTITDNQGHTALDCVRKYGSPSYAAEMEKLFAEYDGSAAAQPGHRQYSDADITALTDQYIDRYGLKGLSKEEAELAKPFFSTLFIYFHNQAVQKDHSKICWRRECDLTANQPVFLTATKVLCVDCALQYLIGNCRDWYYYLSNFEAQAGAIPSDIQELGNTIKEQITQLRNKKTDELSDEDLVNYILDDSNDMASRAEAVLKIRDPETVNRLVDQTKAYPILLNALDFDLPRDTVVKIIERQTMNTEWAGRVRKKATLKLSEEDLEKVLDGEIPGAIFPAIRSIENKEFLKNYIETTKYDDNREEAVKRLQELDRPEQAKPEEGE